MAQEKYAYEGNTGDLFADDDPLAELARIVGYDQPLPRLQPPVQRAEVAPAPAPALVVPASRGAPAFDLEDELLKEFERYDAPELDPSSAISLDGPAGPQWAGQVEAPAIEAAPEPLRAFTENPVPFPSHARSPAFEALFERPPAEQVEEESFDFDLADELELAVANDDVADFAPVPEERSGALRLPLTNFQPSRCEPSFDEAAEAAFVEQREPVYDSGHFSGVEDVVEVEPEPVAVVAPVRREPELPVEDAVAADEFELALDGLEIDLSDIVLNEVEAVVPSVRAGEVASVPEPEPEPVAVVADEPVWDDGSRGFAEASAEGDMPFDASQIADPDYAPEAIAEMEVPDLPVHEPEAPKAYQPVFDADFEADIADLLHDERAVATAAAAAVAASAKPAEAVQPVKSAAVDLDDFSLMMNEDFREAVSNPLGLERQSGRVVIDPDNMEGMELEGGNRVRTWLIAAAASFAVLASGTGVYFWMKSGGATGFAGNGGPPIVVADAEPIKVAPENPGGKTVPNQDKAVYDRVAGGMPQAPTQKSLISSSEEPMDVVQRTLTPENFPLERAEDEDMADAEDQRLQPDAATETAAADKAADTNVSLRKVRTMIVRPDGTLVARDVPETAPATTAASQQQQTAAPLPASSATSAPAAQAPLRPAETAAAETASNAALSQAAASTVTDARTGRAAAGERPPVPAQRPAEQPVNVVSTVTGAGNVRPAAPPAAQQAAPQQVAAATPPVAATATPAGAYVVQIASLPSQAEAEKSYKSMSGKFGSVIGGRGVDIKAADIPGKGTFYRVRIVAGSKDDANALCGKLKAAGGSCLVTR